MATPLSRRPGDFVFIGFFIVNLFFITYIVDIEQLTIANPFDFTYPIWPPRPLVDMVHWWGRNFDPALMAREPWWRATIWIDALGFGPFYALAIYAFIKGRDWIRIPCFIWAGLMMANVIIILFEEMIGRHPTPRPGLMIAANLPWLLFPLLVILRMALRDRPFAEQRQ